MSIENVAALGTIGANVNFFSAFQQFLPEMLIGLSLPNGSKAIGFGIPQAVTRVFIKTTRYYHAIPGDDTRMPHLPACIHQFVFYLPLAIGFLLVSGIFFYGWNERIAKGIIINLSRF